MAARPAVLRRAERSKVVLCGGADGPREWLEVTARDPHSMTQLELKLLLARLTEREQVVSEERQGLHVQIDVLRKELVDRMRDEGTTVIAGEDSSGPGLTGVRDPRRPRPKAGSDGAAVSERRNPVSDDRPSAGALLVGDVPIGGSAVEQVVRELSSRELRRDFRRRHHPGPPILRRPDPASIRVLSERRTSDRCAVAIAVNDMDGERCLVIAVFTDDGDGLRRAGGCEGPDRDVPGRRGPFLGLYAYVSDGVFFAGGRVQSDGLDIARVRLFWEDDYELADVVQNGVVMFFGARDFWEAATVEFLDSSGQVIGSHQVFGPDER